MVQNNIHETDVLIFGGGPSGSSAALSLLNHSASKVTIVEHSDFEQVRVGEQVSASIFELIDYLKIDREDFGEACFTPSFYGVSYWGSDIPSSRESIFSAEGASFQLDRVKFDFTLIEKVVDRGGYVFPRTKCLMLDRTEDAYWEARLKHPDHGVFTVRAKYLIDATGRNAKISRRIGMPPKKVDKLVGVGSFFTFQDQRPLPNDQLIETTELGWWYSALLPNQTLVATFFSDADVISKYRLNHTDNWLKLLQASGKMKTRLSGAQSNQGKPWIRSAVSQISNAHQYKNFIAVGDAACSFDPISSMGLGFAMTSACRAATAIMTEQHHSEAIVNYKKDITKNFEQYLVTRRQHYQQEKRWPESIFWCRRSA
ncbi:MAG: lysine-epsilon-oxidase maturase LodB [Pseudomonadales bacterium]|nr:lysine-epsilon-oxidase maturase LodB [Pseudomonadales bacterium]